MTDVADSSFMVSLMPAIVYVAMLPTMQGESPTILGRLAEHPILTIAVVSVPMLVATWHLPSTETFWAILLVPAMLPVGFLARWLLNRLLPRISSSRKENQS